MVMGVWDMDGVALQAIDDPEWTEEPDGRLSEVCFLDPSCRERQAAAVGAVIEDLSTVDLAGQMKAAAELTAVAAEQDPRGHCDAVLVRNERQNLLDWIGEASALVGKLW